jgi:FkbM family methyltransferase
MDIKISTASLPSRLQKRISRSLEVLIFGNRYSIYSQRLLAHHTLSFSQEGEDLILKRIFERQEQGFYVDVGAHHPQRFSNTYLFYLKGWRGINIDAMPGSMEPFDDLRPEDINIEFAISDVSEELTYYIFNEPALNGFSEKLSAERDGLQDFRIVDKKRIKTKRLSDIFDEYLSEGQAIDFLTIDVEGLDHQVLVSNNWSKYKPKVILVEELAISLEILSQKSQTFCLLKEHGYELFAKTFNTSFYKLIS